MIDSRQSRLKVVFAALAVMVLTVMVMAPAGGAAAPSGVGGGPGSGQGPGDEAVIPGAYIVVLRSGEAGSVAAEHARAHGASVSNVYRNTITGYAARMSEQAAARIAGDPRVAYVDQDRVVTTAHHQCGHVTKRGVGQCGQVAGTVSASTGGAVPGATVSADGKSALTDATGSYTIADVTPNTSVTVTASATGFVTATQTADVGADGTTTVDFALVAEETGGEPPVVDEPVVDEPVVDEPVTYDVPTGVARIGWTTSSAVGAGGAVAAKAYPAVAVIDTGIATGHPDLDVRGGRNCSTGGANAYGDGNGHGTHVAGTVAANGAIVGVAPGAPLYAVRVLNNAGSGSWSSIICGVDWVTANAQRLNIAVANMSLGGSGTAGSSCAASSLRQAICASVDAGITYVAAAGNSAADTSGFVPAAYPETIAVAAIADFNGQAGGGAAATCRNDTDDTHANFSNYGTVAAGQPGHVAITAPGVCITSTWHSGSGYNTISGTSMASPHVAGAAALYLTGTGVDQSPAGVRSALVAAANTGYAYTWGSANTTVPGVKAPLLFVGAL